MANSITARDSIKVLIEYAESNKEIASGEKEFYTRDVLPRPTIKNRGALPLWETKRNELRGVLSTLVGLSYVESRQEGVYVWYKFYPGTLDFLKERIQKEQGEF